MPTIQEYINDRNKYKVDQTYQRPSDAWSSEDNQCFVNTILRDEPIPIFFLNYNFTEKLYYIVDGQQRLNCISKFYDNKMRLNRKNYCITKRYPNQGVSQQAQGRRTRR